MHVRGAEPGDDTGRFEPAYVLAARVAAVIKNLDPVHLKLLPGNPRDGSPLAVDGPGAEIVFDFTFETNVAQDPAILSAIKRAITSVSPPNPDQPGGDNGKTYEIVTSTIGERP